MREIPFFPVEAFQKFFAREYLLKVLIRVFTEGVD